MKQRNKRKFSLNQKLNYEKSMIKAFDGNNHHKFYLDQVGLMEDVNKIEYMSYLFRIWLIEKGYIHLNLKFRNPSFVPEETKKLYKQFLEYHNKTLSEDHEKE